jgi:hypothetical protein
VDSGFPIKIMCKTVQQQSGGWAMTGNGPSHGPTSFKDRPYYRKDGRHPKFKDHGRIAGR